MGTMLIPNIIAQLVDYHYYYTGDVSVHVHGFDPCSNHEVLFHENLGTCIIIINKTTLLDNIMVSRIVSCFWEIELPTDRMHSYFLATYQWCFKA